MSNYEKFCEIDSGIIEDVAPETVEPEIQDSSDAKRTLIDDEADQQKGTEEKENTSAKSTDGKSENGDPEPFEKNKSDKETELETLEQNPSEKNEDSSDDVKINFTENIVVQSDDFTSVESTEQPISDESTAGQELDNEPNSEVDEAAEDIVERAIQDALEDETPTEEPTKADLKENETEESEFIVQKDHSGEKIDFEKIEKIIENEGDIKENIENGEIGNQGIDLKYYFERLSEPKSAKLSFLFYYQKFLFLTRSLASRFVSLSSFWIV